jgi:hypothetical protein
MADKKDEKKTREHEFESEETVILPLKEAETVLVEEDTEQLTEEEEELSKALEISLKAHVGKLAIGQVQRALALQESLHDVEANIGKFITNADQYIAISNHFKTLAPQLFAHERQQPNDSEAGSFKATAVSISADNGGVPGADQFFKRVLEGAGDGDTQGVGSEGSLLPVTVLNEKGGPPR